MFRSQSLTPLAWTGVAVVAAGVPLLTANHNSLSMVTIAFGIIVEAALVEWVSLTGGPGGVFNIPRPAFLGHPLTLARYYFVVALAAAVALWVMRSLMRSAWGRAFVAVKDSELA